VPEIAGRFADFLLFLAPLTAAAIFRLDATGRTVRATMTLQHWFKAVQLLVISARSAGISGGAFRGSSPALVVDPPY